MGTRQPPLPVTLKLSPQPIQSDMEDKLWRDGPARQRDQPMPSVLTTENATHNVPAMSPRSLVSVDKISIATGASSSSQVTMPKRTSINFANPEAPSFSPLNHIKDRFSVSYTSLTDNSPIGSETRKQKRANGSPHDLRPNNPTPFIFSYDCFKRVPAAAEAIKKMEEEINRALKDYYSNALSYHHNSNSVSGAVGGNRASNSTMGFTTESYSTNGLTHLFRANATGAHTAMSYGTRIGSIFNTTTNQSQRTLIQIYSRASSSLQAILSKNHRRVNGFLPFRRRIFAFLFQPFALRPLNGNPSCSYGVL